jgi:DNA-binding SARP family transcriptional activator
MSLQIMLTGQLAAEADGARADATDLPGRQASLVFAYLVAERDRPVPSEELAEAVWDGALPPTWRPALRGVVSKVRDFLDQLGLAASDALTSVSGCYRLTLPADTAVDVEQAAGEADTARSALRAGDLGQALAAAGRARAIAGRPLLPGHEGTWVEDRRAALRQVLIGGLETLVDIHLAAGNGHAAVGPARELVALEPFRDSAHERVLRAHAAAGDRGEALRAYDRYRRVLAEELGVGPSPKLEAAYLELLHAEPLASSPVGPPAPAAPVAGAFVGRRPELGRLRSALAQAKAGRRRTVLVAGEAGIGKTRLGAELAAHAERDGAIVLAGRCDPHLGVPYLPLREALGRHLAEVPAGRLRALLGPRAAELARVWPELAWRLPATPAPARADPRADRYLLFEALTGVLEAIADAGPLLLLVDDLHGADEASLQLLRSLAHAPRPARLLTVLTYRDDEPASRANLAAALGDLLRGPGAELLTLEGLTTDEVASLAAVTVGRPLGAGGAALAQVLRERTSGNPFFAGELLRHLIETGGLEGRDAAAAAGPAARGLPESVRRVAGQRLARLGGAVERALGVAAVIGHRFDLALLGRVVDLGHDALLSALDTAVAAKLLEERIATPGRYAFRHPLVRDLLYAGLPAGERARAHRRIGEALEELTGGRTRLGELADHFALAGEGSAARTVDYARRAGEQAFGQCRYEESAHRFRQGLSAIDQAGAADGAAELRCDLLLDLGRAWTAAGQAARATEAYLEAADAARTAGSAERLVAAALGLGGPAAFWSTESGRDRPVQLLRDALVAVGADDGAPRALLLSRLAGWQAVSALLVSELVQEPPPFREAIAMARRVGDRGTLAAVLADQETVWSGVLRPDGPGAALDATAELDRLAVELGDEGLAYRASLARAGALLTAGDLDGVDRLADREGRIAEERHIPHHRWLSLTLEASHAMARGDLGDGERLTEDALKVGRGPLEAAAVLAHGAQLVVLRWLQGRPADVEAFVERLIRQQPWAAGGLSRLLTLAYAGQGRDADARGQLDAAIAQGLAGRSAAELVGLVGACAQLGDGDAAERVLRSLLPWAGHHLATGHIYLGSADHHLAILAATAGRWEDALHHLRIARAAHGRLGARPWQALSSQAYAGVLRGRGRPGDRALAQALEDSARSLAGRLGMDLPGWGRSTLGPRP